MATGRVTDPYVGYRARLVEQLQAEGVTDLAVLRAVALTPRHAFVPEALWEHAYDDVALPIGQGQTISRPLTQARWLSTLRLRGHERVLEIGTGSGYQAALLSHLVSQVFTIERLPRLAAQARAALERAGCRNVSVLVGDGSLGWRAYAPYDAILVAAAAPAVPEPLLDQLADGGRLLVPVGGLDHQETLCFTRQGSQFREERISAANFVPLRGQHGRPDHDSPANPGAP